MRPYNPEVIIKPDFYIKAICPIKQENHNCYKKF